MNKSASFSGQIIGTVTIFVWIFTTSLIVCGIIKATLGICISTEEEYEGADISECEQEAYLEFAKC